MTSVWMGLSKLNQELDSGRLELDGDDKIAHAMQAWLGLSSFAPLARRAP
jgi:hypothetical protein